MLVCDKTKHKFTRFPPPASAIWKGRLNWTKRNRVWETLWLCVRKIPTMMVRPYDGQTEQQQRQHQAVDGLFYLFTTANHDLTLLHNKLQREFQQLYPDNVFFVQIPPSRFDSTVLFSLLRTEVLSFGISAGKPPTLFSLYCRGSLLRAQNLNSFVGFLFQANPMKLVARIKKIQEDVSFLSEQCRELLAAKQVSVHNFLYLLFLISFCIYWELYFLV